MVLPIFLFLMLTVLYLFEVGLLQMQIRDGLYDIALLQARTAYLTQSDPDESVLSSLAGSGVTAAVSSLSIRDGIDSRLCSLVSGGASGIVCTEDTENSSDNVTALTAQCTVQLPVSVFGTLQFTISESVSVRNWTGYDPSDTDLADYVYVTATGTVYHEDRNCTYLNPSIKTVSADSISGLRNSSGGRYTACEKCGSASSSGVYYITAYGDAYHTSLTCSGLKRTVYLVARDETDLPACSKCSGSSE